MGNGCTSPDEPPAGRDPFPPTHWSVVLCAGQGSSAEAREAFGQLYRAYAPPLTAYLRCRGHTEDAARELLQGFFEFLLEKHGLAKARPAGKFRAWLLACLKNFLRDVRDKQTALKRGGGRADVPLDADPETGAVEPPHPGRTPDQEYDRQFALRFLELVSERLQAEYRARNKTSLFDHLRPFLLDKRGTVAHAELGRRLDMSEAHVNKEVSRLRQRFREIFDGELERLIGDRGELQEEKRFLFGALSS